MLLFPSSSSDIQFSDILASRNFQSMVGKFLNDSFIRFKIVMWQVMEIFYILWAALFISALLVNRGVNVRTAQLKGNSENKVIYNMFGWNELDHLKCIWFILLAFIYLIRIVVVVAISSSLRTSSMRCRPFWSDSWAENQFYWFWACCCHLH